MLHVWLCIANTLENIFISWNVSNIVRLSIYIHKWTNTNFIEVSMCCPPRGQLWPLPHLQHLISTLNWKWMIHIQIPLRRGITYNYKTSGSKVLFLKVWLVAILDLCKLPELLRVAVWEVNVNCFLGTDESKQINQNVYRKEQL